MIVPNIGVVFAELTNIQFGDDEKSILSASYVYENQKAIVKGNSSNYDKQLYIEGDFTNSWNEASNYEKNPPGYWLTGRNCS